MLGDSEWGKWSNREIARRCCVGPDLARELRRSLAETVSDAKKDTPTTYELRHPQLTDYPGALVAVATPARKLDVGSDMGPTNFQRHDMVHDWRSGIIGPAQASREPNPAELTAPAIALGYLSP